MSIRDLLESGLALRLSRCAAGVTSVESSANIADSCGAWMSSGSRVARRNGALPTSWLQSRMTRRRLMLDRTTSQQTNGNTDEFERR